MCDLPVVPGTANAAQAIISAGSCSPHNVAHHTILKVDGQRCLHSYPQQIAVSERWGRKRRVPDRGALWAWCPGDAKAQRYKGHRNPTKVGAETPGTLWVTQRRKGIKGIAIQRR